MRDHKQNVFDDFHAAAEHLVADGWTTPSQLAISGGSNGGLLVGAALTQRPELYAAVVCSAPLLDMVRYEQFGLGATWNDEYGTRRRPRGARLAAGLLAVPPRPRGRRLPGDAVHRLRRRHPGRPAARPQDVRRAAARHQPATRPVLLRRERDVGHGARALSRSVALTRRHAGLRGALDGPAAARLTSLASTATDEPAPLEDSPCRSRPSRPPCPRPSTRSDIRFRSCVDDKQTGTLCDCVYDLTGNDWLAESADWLLAKPAAIVVDPRCVARRHPLPAAPADPPARRTRAAEGTVPGVLAKGKGHKLLGRARCSPSGAGSAPRRCPRCCAASTTGVIIERRVPDDPRRARPPDRAAAGQRRHRRRRGRLRRADAGEGLPVRASS